MSNSHGDYIDTLKAHLEAAESSLEKLQKAYDKLMERYARACGKNIEYQNHIAVLDGQIEEIKVNQMRLETALHELLTEVVEEIRRGKADKD